MKTPKNCLEERGATYAEIESMLDELQEHVESIDMENDFYTIGGLFPFLEHLKNSSAGIQAKASKVVSILVQNNPKSRQLPIAPSAILCKSYIMYVLEKCLDVSLRKISPVHINMYQGFT
ncbi:hypothetical protein MKX03_004355 [Papaver bracteatum]|nr:hypothetical protein MKX03_004355 [Papaver bracteatum]